MDKPNLVISRNDKFSTALLGIYVSLPLTPHNLAYANLLTHCQLLATERFPSIQQQQTKLAQMYGMQFEASPMVFGNKLLIGYWCSMVEPIEFLDPDYTYQKCVSLFTSLVQQPLFNEQLLDLAKRQLLSEWHEAMQEPANLAYKNFFDHWYQKRPEYAYSFIGPIDQIKKATPADLQNFVENLANLPTIFLANSQSPAAIKKSLEDAIFWHGFYEPFKPEDVVIKADPLDAEFEDDQGNMQVQLLLGYGMTDTSFDQQLALKVLSEYLTGDQSSKLFIKVREELGAAYAIDSTAYGNNSLFLINAGLDPKLAGQAEEIIRNEIAAVAKGEVDEALLAQTKRRMLNSELILQDRQEWSLQQLLRKQLLAGYADFDRTQALKKLTKTKLQQAAASIFFNERYVLK